MATALPVHGRFVAVTDGTVCLAVAAIAWWRVSFSIEFMTLVSELTSRVQKIETLRSRYAHGALLHLSSISSC